MDFMLDENMKLWFIECNSSPLLDGVVPEMITKMLADMFDIQFAYYRSRMARLVHFIQNIQQNEFNEETGNDFLRERYKEVIRNRIDPAFQPSKNNSWELIIDSNMGKDQFFGLISSEC